MKTAVPLAIIFLCGVVWPIERAFWRKVALGFVTGAALQVLTR